jgi:hypothetical protein
MVATKPGRVSTFAFQLVILMLALASSGCPVLGPLVAGESGITGLTYVYGCGNVHEPPWPTDCGDAAPIQTAFTILRADRETEVARVTSEADGTFRVALLPGTYWIRGFGSFDVTPGKYTEVNIGYPRG